ncbi:c-type cytochrome [Bradyrhizobium sp.]|uniref:c-type cytochrome n=1 Tax=Bradyrhizobium sp. TaxID=376 RepID=UPI003C34832D
MRRSVLVIGMLVLGAAAAMAQEDLVKQDQAVMKANAKNLGAMVAMVKGEKPYDQATVDASLAVLQNTAKKLPTMFPDSIKGQNPDGDYHSSPKVWEDKAGFAAHIASFTKVVSDAKGKIRDLETLKAITPGIGKECGGCHETYRLKNS